MFYNYLFTMNMKMVFISGLFNSFDSICLISMFIWLTLFVPSFTPVNSMFMLNCRSKLMTNYFYISLNMIFNEVNHLNNLKGFNIIFLTLFLLIFNLNFLSLSGYIFSSTGHIVLNLSMSLLFWSFSIMISLSKGPSKILSQFTPENTPIFLISFLILIESLSWLMRPLVLSIRLTANLFAGHLLMCLMSSFKINSLVLLFSLIQVLFLILEMMVSLIQAYIFSLLCLSYFMEILN